MKNYNSPEMEILEFTAVDIICGSGEDPIGDIHETDDDDDP